MALAVCSVQIWISGYFLTFWILIYLPLPLKRQQKTVRHHTKLKISYPPEMWGHACLSCPACPALSYYRNFAGTSNNLGNNEQHSVKVKRLSEQVWLPIWGVCFVFCTFVQKHASKKMLCCFVFVYCGHLSNETANTDWNICGFYKTKKTFLIDVILIFFC